MRRSWVGAPGLAGTVGLVALVVLLGAGRAQAQAAQAGQANPAAPAVEPRPQSAGDSQVLREILTEMRGIHNDVRLSETTQILLTELQVQHAAVDKAMEKRDNARNRVSQLQMNEKNFAVQIAQDEENASATLDPVQQKQLAAQEQAMKNNIAMFKSQEQDATSLLQDAENALTKEQDALSAIQDQLDDVVKQLQPAK